MLWNFVQTFVFHCMFGQQQSIQQTNHYNFKTGHNLGRNHFLISGLISLGSFWEISLGYSWETRAVRGEVPLYGVLFQRGSVLNHNVINNGRNRFAGRNMKMHMISWMDMPDDVYFVATTATRYPAAQRSLFSTSPRLHPRCPHPPSSTSATVSRKKK